jgi:hypothetical protein
MQIVVHRCGDAAPVVRDATPQEEAEIAAYRAAFPASRRSPRLQDVIAVLTPEQRAALDAMLAP